MSDCTCLYGGYDEYDEGSFQSRTFVTARKDHVCVECKALIRKGDIYVRFASRNDGRVFSNRTCAVCEEIRESLYCDGYYFGRMWADIREQLFPHFTIACVDKLKTVAAKEELTRRYREFLGVTS